MHSNSPNKTVMELERVLKPGGIIILAEPNNIINPLLQLGDSWDNIEKAMDLVKFHLTTHGSLKLSRGSEKCGVNRI